LREYLSDAVIRKDDGVSFFRGVDHFGRVDVDARKKRDLHSAPVDATPISETE
jgi:hypothetical protein